MNDQFAMKIPGQLTKQIQTLAYVVAASTVLTMLGIVSGGIIDPNYTINGLEVAAVWTSYICTILCVVQWRANYYFGVVTTFLYSILFYQSGLAALATFNAVLVLSLVYGWYRWGPDGKPLPVTDVKTRNEWEGYFGFAIIVAIGMYGIYELFGTEVVQIDVLIASVSAAAQLMLDNKKRQTWIIWAIVNVFSIYLFINQGLYVVAVQYVFFLGNTVAGWFAWTKSMREK